jgi:molybdopterin synthase catalytic subunit
VTSPIVITGLAREPIDPSALVARIRRADCGAVVIFEGRARTPNGGRDVLFLDYEAHDERAQGQLDAFAREVVDAHGLGGVVAVHRVGRVAAGAPSVVVAAAAGHRDAAFLATRELIDRIKAEAAIWKKEVFADGHAAWAGVGGPDDGRAAVVGG